MKYVRKITALILSIIFCAALVIGIGVIFSIKNVNVEYIDYSGEYLEEYEATKQKLNMLKGSGLLFLNEEDVTEKVTDDSVITVESYTKAFPCTLNVVLRERVECFAVRKLNGYSVYDEEGKFIKSGAYKDGQVIPLNSLDGSPDVLLNVDDEDIPAVAELCGYFKEEFGSLRRLVESVTVTSQLDVTVASFSMRSGLDIAVSNWKVNGLEKLREAHLIYSGLTDSQLVCGIITAADGTDSSGPVAKYR